MFIARKTPPRQSQDNWLEWLQFFLEHEARNGHGHAASNGSNAAWNKFIQRILRKVAVVLVAVAVVVCGGGLWFVLKNQMSIRHDIGVFLNGGTPKSSILIGFSIINHPFWGTFIFGNTHMLSHISWSEFMFVICWEVEKVAIHRWNSTRNPEIIWRGKGVPSWSFFVTVHVHVRFLQQRN